jgi:hypothetical protein
VRSRVAAVRLQTKQQKHNKNPFITATGQKSLIKENNNKSMMMSICLWNVYDDSGQQNNETMFAMALKSIQASSDCIDLFFKAILHPSASKLTSHSQLASKQP